VGDNYSDIIIAIGREFQKLDKDIKYLNL